MPIGRINMSSTWMIMVNSRRGLLYRHNRRSHIGKRLPGEFVLSILCLIINYVAHSQVIATVLLDFIVFKPWVTGVNFTWCDKDHLSVKGAAVV